MVFNILTKWLSTYICALHAGDRLRDSAKDFAKMSKSNGPANCHRNRWRRHDPARQAVMRRELERVLTTPDLSKNTYEMVSKSVA
jgi:hypothetical protein